MKEIIIYTDGACSGNPGPGGYGAILQTGNYRKEFSQGYRLTTNNRMELMAVLTALQALKNTKDYQIKLYTDSKLIVNAINDNWLEKWKKKNWMRNHKDPVINPDLWAEIYSLLGKHKIEVIWVAGHSGIQGNEECDRLARAAASSDDLLIDEEYEKTLENKLIKI